MRVYRFAVGRVDAGAFCTACGDPGTPHVCVNLGELTLLRLCLDCAEELGGDLADVAAGVLEVDLPLRGGLSKSGPRKKRE